MPTLVPIAITILSCQDRFLFIKRRKAPYEDLWSLVGGKVGLGEHIRDAAIREVLEETGAPSVVGYSYRGFVSERLIQPDGELSSHFLIFVGFGQISTFESGHREGDLALFTTDEIEARKEKFLPSDWFMFRAFLEPANSPQIYEAELIQDGSKYFLNYYRKVDD